MLVGWGNRRLAVDIAGPTSQRLAEFVLSACRADEYGNASRATIVLVDEPNDTLRIVDPKGIVTRYATFAAAVDGLMAVLVEGLVRDVTDGPAFHAAATAHGDKAIVMPGVCGAGKSTLTAWLCRARGHAYLTDEAILLRADTHAIEFIRRPLHLKPGSQPVVQKLGFDRFEAAHVVQDRGHYFVSPDAFPAPSANGIAVGAVVFPTFDANASAQLTPMSGAQAAGRLLEVVLNSPNLPDKGFPTTVAALADVPCFALRYGDKSELPSAFDQVEAAMLNRS